MRVPAVLAASLLLAPFVVPAPGSDVYRCVGGDGDVSFSDRPCAERAREERLEVTLPASGWDSAEIRARNQPLLEEYDARQAQRRAQRRAAEEARARRQAEERERQTDLGGPDRDVRYIICPNGRFCPPWSRPGHWPPPFPPPPVPPPVPPPAPPDPKPQDRLPPNPRAPMSIPPGVPSIR